LSAGSTRNMKNVLAAAEWAYAKIADSKAYWS
jgi:hypothetical protein